MQMIKEISEYIGSELEDAAKYAKMALKYENYDKELAEMYHKLSEEESKHVDIFHKQGVRLIEAHKAEGKTVPEAMQAVYDYLHEKHIERANEVKMYQSQYNNK